MHADKVFDRKTRNRVLAIADVKGALSERWRVSEKSGTL